MDPQKIKVMIADDEFWIREKFRTIIDWSAHSFEFLEPAEDGEDALEKIGRRPPEILITDISMPFLNGAELITKVKSAYPNVVCIALSGYSDYEFVRAAMIAGAMDYLLKPISVTDLLKILSKAVSQIMAQYSEQKENQAIQEKLKQASSLAMDREFSILVHRSGDSKLQIQSQSRLSEYELVLPGFTMFMFRTVNILRIAKATQTNTLDFVIYKIKEAILSRINAQNNIVFNNTYRTNEFILLTGLPEAELKMVCTQIIDALQQITHSPVVAVIGRYHYSFEQVKNSYDEIRLTYYSREYIEKNEVLTISDFSNYTVVNRITKDQEKQLVHAAATDNQSLFMNVINCSIHLPQCVKEKWRYIEVRQTVDSIAWILRKSAEKGTKRMSLLSVDNMMETLLLAVDNYDVQEIMNLIEQMATYILTVADSSQNDSIKSIVLKVQEYIDQNFADELSLSSLSQQFHVDNSYLSRAFNQIVGENLILYISRKRMDAAKSYMKNKDLSLTDIASLIGYGDYSYFNRVFRKFEGIGPREYRDINEP